MLVKFQGTWFAPSDVTVEIKLGDKNLRYSGHRYRKGVQFVPDFLKDFLPSTAIILEKEPEETIIQEPDLKDLDLDRADVQPEEMEKPAPTRGRKSKNL